MKEIDAPIGVFDSGVGGLTVVREIIRQLPSENIVYFGDTARVPYGTKSRDTVINYSEQIVHFLMTKEVKAIVIACNTATSYALDVLKDKLDIPIIGVVRPGAITAVNATRNGRIGIIATEGTVGSKIYPRVIREYNPEIQVVQKACPLFVSLVEEGWTNDPVTDEVARRYLRSLLDSNIDTLVLGCTHYPLIRKTIGRIERKMTGQRSRSWEEMAFRSTGKILTFVTWSSWWMHNSLSCSGICLIMQVNI